jgi:hypothetical protein
MSNGHAIFSKEVSWGTTPSTGYRELEVNSDGHKTEREILTHRGLRSAGSAPRATGRRIQKQKGTGTIEVPGFSNGLGILMRTAASTAASAVHSGGTLAFDQTYTWTGAGVPADRSVTAELYRDRENGTFDAYTYSGGRCTQLEIGQDLAGLLQFKFGMDYKSVVRQVSLPSRSAVEVTPDLIYGWEDAQIRLVEVGGSLTARCMESFNLTIPNELDVDNWCLNRGTTRHQPLRKGLPAPSGTMKWKYQDPVFYDAFVAGTQFEVVADWIGTTAIEDTTFPGLTISLACIEFSGDDPEVTVDDYTTQDLPFVVLDNETDPAVSMVFVTSDTDF